MTPSVLDISAPFDSRRKCNNFCKIAIFLHLLSVKSKQIVTHVHYPLPQTFPPVFEQSIHEMA